MGLGYRAPGLPRRCPIRLETPPTCRPSWKLYTTWISLFPAPHQHLTDPYLRHLLSCLLCISSPWRLGFPERGLQTRGPVQDEVTEVWGENTRISRASNNGKDTVFPSIYLGIGTGPSLLCQSDHLRSYSKVTYRTAWPHWPETEQGLQTWRAWHPLLCFPCDLTFCRAGGPGQMDLLFVFTK